MPVRQRPRHGLYPLWEGLQFTPSNCRLDKLELSFSGVLRIPSVADISRLQASLAEAELPLFTTASGVAMPRRTQRIRKGWLIGGRLKFLPESYSMGRMEVLLKLELNPTRLAAHVIRLADSFDALQQVRPERLLARDEEVTADLRRMSLDGNDNIIPDGEWLGEITSQWQGFTAFYVRSALALVQERVERAAAGIGDGNCTVRFRNSRLFPPKVGRVEVHCEVREPRAILAMTSIGDAARAGLPRIVRRGGDFSSGRMRGAPWLQLQIRKGVSMSVYAKSRERIRMEVAYSPRAQLSLGTLPLPNNRFSAGTGYQAKLARLMTDATARMNTVLPVLVGDETVNSRDAATALADFLLRVATIAGRPNQAARRRAIIDAVLAGEVVARTGDPLFQAASHLAAEGILERTPGGLSSPPVFRPAAGYQELIERMRAVAFSADGLGRRRSG